MNIKNKKLIFAGIAIILIISAAVIAGKYYHLFKLAQKSAESLTAATSEKNEQLAKADKVEEPVAVMEDKNSADKNYINSSLKLVAYNGQIYSAKIPEGWRVDESISGINIANPEDSNMGVALIAVSGWPGKSSPDAFIEKIAGMGGLTDIKYISESKEGQLTNSAAPGYIWKEKTKIFTCKKDGTSLKIKADAGVINGQGQYVAVFKGFQTTPGKWDKWAPLLERVALSAIITNPSKVGGADKVRHISAKDLANDSSPLMDAWNYRNGVEDRASHNFSDATMGVESDLVSPSTGQSYTLPLSSYDPTEGGYHNPNNYSEILEDLYK